MDIINYPLFLCALTNPSWLRPMILRLNTVRNQVITPLVIALGSLLAVAAVIYISILVYREFKYSTRRV